MRNTIVKILFSFCLLFASLTTRAGYEFCSINVSEEKGLTSNEVSRVFQDEHGYINIQDRRGQYVRFDGYSFHSLSSQEAKKLVLPHNTVSPDGKKYLDEEGNPYLVTPQGDFVFTDKRTGEEIRFPLFNQKVKQLTNAMRICVVFDRRELLWVSVNGNGIFVYDRAKHGLRHFTQDSPGTIVRSDYIVDMCKDDKGNIWISQLHFGISCIQVIPKKYAVIPVQPSRRKSARYACSKRGLTAASSLLTRMATSTSLTTSSSLLRPRYPMVRSISPWAMMGSIACGWVPGKMDCA